MEERRSERPTAEEVIAKLKDDGDFDNLRLQIIRTVKQNEEIKNKIISEVKQSEVFNKDGSDVLKPSELTDAVYQELGKKIMGQVSDEVWKIIRSESTKKDIRSTVESVYERIVNPKPEQHSPSPNKEGNLETDKNSNAIELSTQTDKSSNAEELKVDNTNENGKEDEDLNPSGFAMPVINNGSVDRLPNLSENGNTNVMQYGFGPGVVRDDDDDDDDLDAPPGFG